MRRWHRATADGTARWCYCNNDRNGSQTAATWGQPSTLQDEKICI